jgi:putative redox protein
MTTSKVRYTGQLRTEAIHTASGSELIIDAPVDNHGQGRSFSPTDLAATSLASCMMTVMGIKAKQLGVVFDGAEAEVKKVMSPPPRRILRVEIDMRIPNTEWTQEIRVVMEKTAHECPVALSLHPDVVIKVQFLYE